MHTEVKWAVQVAKVTSSVAPEIADDGYPTGAWAIVEPWATEEYPTPIEASTYYEFQDTNPKSWATWIRSNFGPAWGDVADIINEEGY